jgi:hypothetical protein
MLGLLYALICMRLPSEKNSGKPRSLYGFYLYGPPKNKLDMEGGRRKCVQTEEFNVT